MDIVSSSVHVKLYLILRVFAASRTWLKLEVSVLTVRSVVISLRLVRSFKQEGCLIREVWEVKEICSFSIMDDMFSTISMAFSASDKASPTLF